MYNHFVRIVNLEPGAAYTFRIVDSEGKSQDYWFSTASASQDAKLSFLAGGDSRTFREPRQRGNRMVAKVRPDGVIFAGDMINHGNDEEWQNWLDDWQHTIAEDGRVTPIIAARGNHEKKNADLHKLFDVPSRKVYYDLRFAGGLMQLYTLNTEMAIKSGQTRWLKKTMAEKSAGTIWSIVQYHRPARPHIARKPEGKTQYEKWIPVFEKNGVKLVIECDSHTHKITWPIRKSDDEGNDEGFVKDSSKGIVYVGEGCWGAPLQTNDDDKSWTRDSGRINQVKWIVVSKKQLELRTIEFDNVDEVSSVSDSDRFSPPAGIKLRKIGDSDVVVITK